MGFTTPSGFRDVLAEEAICRERISRAVADMLNARGYVPIETPTLEIMDVMRAGGRIPPSAFRFFDSKGDLLAMRPDVTLQVARMCATRLADDASPLRFRYQQRVFREAAGRPQAQARELTQVGIELIGEAGLDADVEVVELFVESLECAGVRNYCICVAAVGVLRSLLEATGAPETWKNEVRNAFHVTNFVALDELTSEDTCSRLSIPANFAQAIRELPRIRGGAKALDAARALVEPLGCDEGLTDLAYLLQTFSQRDLNGCVVVDFSVMSSFDYYTGIVFAAYVPSLGFPLGSGGRYDNMIAAFGTARPAAGFAFYLEQALEAASLCLAQFAETSRDDIGEKPLRIAVPKGSLNPGTIACLSACGLNTSGLENPGRQLIISNPGVDYIIVRPSDAPVFVELGAADCGICGKDSLLEADAGVVELADLGFGACRFIVAQPIGADEAVARHYRTQGSIRVATKYPRITANYYAQCGIPVEIVQLRGNIELAPLTGMAERIVDITATGTTLRENNLVIVDEVLSSTARFFANPSAFRTDSRVVELANKLRNGVACGLWEASVIAGGSQGSDASCAV